MRCDEVLRELSVPSQGRDEPALAHHLAGCQACAEWADRAARLDQLWNATRPSDPGPEAWDRLWSTVLERIERPWTDTAHHLNGHGKTAAIPAFASSVRPPAGRRWIGLSRVGIIVLAQAAAVLLAVGWFWNYPTKTVPDKGLASTEGLAKRLVPSLDSVVDVEDGQVPYIRSEGPSVELIDLTARETLNGEDPWFVFFNLVEPGQVVAMQ
jgi:hypothetical protein